MFRTRFILDWTLPPAFSKPLSLYKLNLYKLKCFNSLVWTVSLWKREQMSVHPGRASTEGPRNNPSHVFLVSRWVSWCSLQEQGWSITYRDMANPKGAVPQRNLPQRGWQPPKLAAYRQCHREVSSPQRWCPTLGRGLVSFVAFWAFWALGVSLAS